MDDIRRGAAGTIDRGKEAETAKEATARADHREARRQEVREAFRRGEEAPRRQAQDDERDRAEVRDGGRGRSAKTPSDIPVKGWKDILLRVYRGISDDRVLANAAAVT